MKNNFVYIGFFILIILAGCSDVGSKQCLEKVNVAMENLDSLEESVDALIKKSLRLETENYLLKNCEQTSAFDPRHPGFVWYHCDDDTDMSYWPIEE